LKAWVIAAAAISYHSSDLRPGIGAASAGAPSIKYKSAEELSQKLQGREANRHFFCSTTPPSAMQLSGRMAEIVLAYSATYKIWVCSSAMGLVIGGV
jgi:hypothetical protein